MMLRWSERSDGAGWEKEKKKITVGGKRREGREGREEEEKKEKNSKQMGRKVKLEGESERRGEGVNGGN